MRGEAGPALEIRDDRWRYVADDGVSASFGLAADEWMACRRQGPPCLRLYTYRSHCVLIGRYQRLEAEVNVEACRELGVALNRRPTGGGTILMGADQLGLALTIPASARAAFPGAARDLFPCLAAGLVAALRGLGVAASFHRKNDLEVGGRKIAGLGIFAAPAGGLLFHASLVVDLDLALMLRVLRTPFEKLTDKAVASVAERMTTVRREAGRAVTLDEVRGRVRAGDGEAFGVTLEEEPWTVQERAGIASLEDARYRSAAWLDQPGLAPAAAGRSRHKAVGGLVEVGVTLRGGMIHSCTVTGDFFAAEGQVASLERTLRRTAADPAAVRAAIEGAYAGGARIDGVPPELLAAAVLEAAADAAARREGGQPYGCFIGR